jgi:single-stranded-DNA-specific exonuclease
MFNTPSLTGRLWNVRDYDARTAQAIAQQYELPLTLGALIASRGYDKTTTADYITPKLRSLLPDPLMLKDMAAAVARTYQAMTTGEVLTVYGDYDVDGATASALLRRYLRAIGIPCGLYIPDRIDEGYGANAQALESLKQQGTGLVLMVDCGTNAFEALGHAAAVGLDIIVLDHHTAEAALPPAVAIVNPNRIDQDLGKHTDLRHLCAAGVAFLFCVALNRELRQQGFFTPTRPEPDMRQFIDLVALGTVCDVMPLKGLNRAFVKLGFEVAAKHNNKGIQALCEVAGVYGPLTSYHFGFMLGPRVNAGGRVGLATLGSDLLTTQDGLHAQIIAKELHALNQQRQDIEKHVLAQAIDQIERETLEGRALIMVRGDDWHPGVIGIVASRLKEKFHKPVCVVSFDKGIGKGSGRSIPGVEIGTAMHNALHAGLLEKGGGHAMAAGFTVHATHYAAFYTFLENAFAPLVAKATPTLNLDGVLSLQGITADFIKSLSMLEPFGQGNPAPHFALTRVRPVYTQPVGENHLRVELADEAGKRLKAMAFRAVGTPLGEALSQPHAPYYHLAGTLKHDVWNGRAQTTFIIEDALSI